jgi:hypothetical protein
VLESKGMPPKRFGIGDVIFFRRGAHAVWHVEGYVKKVAFCRQANPLWLGVVIRAVNKFNRMFLRRRASLRAPHRRRLTPSSKRVGASRGAGTTMPAPFD